MPASILNIVGYGAWNGGTRVDNTVFEKMGMVFKGGIPVNAQTIEERIGVRTRVAAPPDVRIGQLALRDLLERTGIAPQRIKMLIGATNVGDDKYETEPLIRHSLDLLGQSHHAATAFDLYAGCPGYNVAVELIFMLSISGVLRSGDISVVVGAENIHRADAFRPGDTSHIIFGDDAVATALETHSNPVPAGRYAASDRLMKPCGERFLQTAARGIADLIGNEPLDGIIVDNQLGSILFRVPATAARIQNALIEIRHPEAAAKDVFKQFKSALQFYDRHVNTFAFDIMSWKQDPGFVERIAASYVRSGRYRSVASVHLDPHEGITVRIHRGAGFVFPRPRYGVVDTLTRTHGCFGDYIHAVTEGDNMFGEIDGKGVFLYATRGAANHLSHLLKRNCLTMDDVELLIEHQANFAMIPLTLAQLLADGRPDVQAAVYEFVADKMVTNIHERGNCSVVCMQRLPYDLYRHALKPDKVQGFAVNRNLEALRRATLVLSDSVGAGMTRSSFLQRLDTPAGDGN